MPRSFNPENFGRNNNEGQPWPGEQKKLFEAASPRAGELLAKERISPDDFKNFYSTRVIEGDEAEVKKRQKNIEKSVLRSRKKCANVPWFLKLLFTT